MTIQNNSFLHKCTKYANLQICLYTNAQNTKIHKYTCTQMHKNVALQNTIIHISTNSRIFKMHLSTNAQNTKIHKYTCTQMHKIKKLAGKRKNFRTLYQIWPKNGTKPGKSFERGYAKLGRDSRFFAADEANLSAEGGDSLK